MASAMSKKRSSTKEDRHSMKERIAEISELPKDVVLGMSVVTMLGQTELCLENYAGIIEYTEELIRIRIKHGQMKIIGKNLNVSYYTNDDMKITGCIECIEYQR